MEKPPRPKTAAEKLDAARDGREFAAAIMELFDALDKARHEDCEHD